MPSPFTPLFASAPAVAVIDQNGVMTLSFTPAANPLTGAFTDYDHWDITTTINAGSNHIVQFDPPAGWTSTGGSLTFVETLTTGIITLTMQAWHDSGETTFLTSPWQTNSVNTTRTFPTALTATDVLFSSTSVLLGQTLTVTLNSAYTGADQWQVIWPDNTNTGWLPLANNVVTKSFNTSGAANVTIQTRRNYSSAVFNPPATLISQIVQQIFVVNQQANGTSAVQGGLTGDLGIGGQQGFEIVNANSGNATPEPWAVIARAIVRDTLTSELKLLIPVSRFSNASSLLGTMAIDVFPLQGRPRSKELIVPPYELTVTSQTETVPVKITTTALPTLFVGKSVTQAIGGTFPLTAANGITPYIWSSIGLPDGLSINASGFLSGTPLELGIFNVTIAVQDSSLPFSIDEVTLPLTIETDLKVQIAPSQKDANNSTLAQQGSTLGVAQVGTPYNVQMQVGNINPNANTPGGLPPYTWSAPAGAFPVGLTINSNTGLVSGTPASYNSTTDFNTTFSVTIQVQDAIGAKATQVYSMTLKPQVLSLGHVDQSTIYTFEQFKMVVPVFGGQSPYHSVVFAPSSDSNFYGPVPSAPVDGQIEIPVGYTAVGGGGFTSGFQNTGVRSFFVQVTDAASSVVTGTLSFNVETEISDINSDRVPLVNWTHSSDGSWGGNDPSQAGQAVNQPVQINGNFNTQFTGSLPAALLAGQRLNLTVAANAVGGNTAYTMPAFANFSNLVNQPVVISGFSNAANNGTFTVQSGTTSTSLLVNNANGVSQTAPTYTLTLTSAANASGGVTVYTYAIASLGNGSLNAYAGLTFIVAGFISPATVNNGTFICVSSTANTITLSNAAGVAQTHAATATTPLAKALQLNTPASTINGTKLIGSVLDNGITVAIDPTSITVSGAPDVEFYGAAGVSTTVSGGSNFIFRNEEYRLPLVVNTVFPLTSVAAGTGVYTGTITGGAANAFAGQKFVVSGWSNGINNGTYICSASTNIAVTLTTDGTTPVVTIAETAVVGQQPIAVNLTSQQQISRDYTTLSHSATFSSGDIGNITTFTRPYIIGDVIGLNPRKPFFDSANIPGFSSNPWIAIVQSGSQLPPGLSLDSNTGLIYGTLISVTSSPSVVEYVDASGNIHGIITINWTILANDFQLTDNVIDSQLVGSVYSGATAFTAPPGIILQSVSMLGTLPNGMGQPSTDGTNIILSGTPSEAGYFDCWFTAISTNGKSASIYHRISTIIPVPTLGIIGWADVLAGPALGVTQPFPLPNGIIGAGYVNPVSGNPIALVFSNAVPALTLTGWTNPTHGISLALGPGFPEPTGTVGLFSGTVAGPSGSVAVSITVTDSDLGHTPFTLSTTLQIQSTALTITTVPSPFPQVLAGEVYAPLVTFTGHGSVLTPFHFSVSPISTAQLPIGLTLTDLSPNQATIQGTTTQTGYGTKVVTIRCQDQSGANVDVPYTVTVVAGLAVTSGLHFTDAANPAAALGLVDAGSVLSINTRPNLSFFIVATNVVSTSTAGISIQTNNSSITGIIPTGGLNTSTQTCQIELSGSGFNQAVSSIPYSVTVTVTDSGVQVSQTFTWIVFSNGTLNLAATNATPTRLTQAT